MNRKTVKQKFRIYHWGGFSDGVELPELTLGYIVIQRNFLIDRDGNIKLDSKVRDRLLVVDDADIDCLWSEVILQEFFPGFTGYALVGEV
jgi:hypothetical protein